MRDVLILLVTGVALMGSTAFAESPKKGRVLCEGAACREADGSAGGALDSSVGAVQDFKDRVTRRANGDATETGNKPSFTPDTSLAAKKIGPRKSKLANAVVVTAPGEPASNLPGYYAGVDRSAVEASEKVVFVPKSHDPTLKGLKSGDVVWAVVEQEITASPEVPTPIRAIAMSGPFKGAYFVGEATLDRELKRVLLSFSKLRLKNNDSVYAVKAAGLSPRGSIGLEGEYVSQTGKFFVAELASAAAAGFVDSTINRGQTALGSYVQEPSLMNAGKTAAVSALSKTTDRMANAVRQAPEFTHLQGYHEIQIMIQDSPVEFGF